MYKEQLVTQKKKCLYDFFNICKYLYYFSGEHRDFLAIISDGHLIGVLPRAEALKAHAIQFGLIWIYGISFGEGGKKAKSERNYFECINYILWDLQPDTREGGKKKRACNPVQDLLRKTQN